ncbi:MAG TPA: HD domain-containing protein [Longimicrobiales bacterium]|nr:HD domain-containing protein [Longimicrobiales bacterium]
MELHPAVARAAEGVLPPWAVMTAERRAHAARVARLLDDWARALEVDEAERARFRAAGILHDALRDECGDALRPRVVPALAELPDALLHGPAAAERLRIDGVEDGELLRAVAYHSLGHPRFGRLARALYAADFLEPGRDLLDGWREALRARMPGDLDGVVREILGARIAHLVEKGSPLRAETTGLWNALVAEGS